MSFPTAIRAGLQGSTPAFGFWLTYVRPLFLLKPRFGTKSENLFPPAQVKWLEKNGRNALQSSKRLTLLPVGFPALASPRRFYTVHPAPQRDLAGCWLMRSTD